MKRVLLFSIAALLLHPSLGRPARESFTDHEFHGRNHTHKHTFPGEEHEHERHREKHHGSQEGQTSFSRTQKCWNKDSNCLWPKSSSGLVKVPYTISRDFTYDEMSAIQSVMKNIAHKSCVRFVPQTNETDFLSIESLSGCWSDLGRSGGKQQVSLSVDDCVKDGTIERHLHRSMGFHHKHNREEFNHIHHEHRPHEHNFHNKRPDGLESVTGSPDSTVPGRRRHETSESEIEKLNKLYECGYADV